jgi:hypothetical protein
MPRTLTMMACVLALSAPAAMAQSTNSNSADTPQYGRQQAQATAFITEDRSKKIFIHDEYGNLYDGRGDMITPRAVTLKHWPTQ